MRSGVPAAAKVSARTTMRRASSILKALSPDGVASARSAAAAARWNGGLIRGGAGQHRLRRAGAPRFKCDTAERDPGFRDHPAVEPECRGGRDDGEGVGRAFADFEVAGMGGEPRRLRPAGAPP